MKNNFLARRKELKIIVQQYNQEVDWIHSGRDENKK
jgi:hypothetical protein